MIRAFARPHSLLLKLVIFQPENQTNSMRSMPFQPWALFERRDTPVKHGIKQIFIIFHLLRRFKRDRFIFLHLEALEYLLFSAQVLKKREIKVGRSRLCSFSQYSLEPACAFVRHHQKAWRSCQMRLF